MASTLLADVKTSLRITHSSLDNDIAAEISACKNDLVGVGLLEATVEEEDERITELCKLYVKGKYDYQGKGQQYWQMYCDLRDATSMNADYTEVQPNV